MRGLAASLVLAVLCGGTSHAVELEPPVPVAHFRFDGNDKNEGSGEARFDLRNTKFENNTLVLNGIYENGREPNGYRAICSMPTLDYTRFTVILRVKPANLVSSKRTLITGGTSHRWFGLSRSLKGKLTVILNNHRVTHQIDDADVPDDKWTVVAASFDLAARTILVFVGGEQVARIELPENFELDVIKGKPEGDKEWSFTNYAYGGTLEGQVDELMIFDRPLSAEELQQVPLVRRPASEEPPAS